jgi:3-oxoacyl-[acyl-carrier-protein] synthase II
MGLASIVGMEASCRLGGDVAEILRQLRPLAGLEGSVRSLPFLPLSEHPSSKLSGWGDLAGGWLSDRKPLLNRRYGMVSNAALAVVGKLISTLAWSPEELAECWVFAATSRGNVVEQTGATERRAFSRLAASNTLHSELAAAISIEHGIRGPWQLISNGCVASLDALGLAGMAIRSGLAPRAIVVGAEMPLCPAILQSFRQSGVLSGRDRLDVYGEATDGFILAEGAAAVALEPASSGSSVHQLLGYQAGSDAWDTMALAPQDKSILPELLRKLASTCPAATLICPHATGTLECRELELALLPSTPKLPLKNAVGHTLGASGLLELVLAKKLAAQSTLWKWASSMGGHHAVVAVQ